MKPLTPYSRMAEKHWREHLPKMVAELEAKVAEAEAARAVLTVTFIGRKVGCYLGEGPEHVGRLVHDDLDVPPETFAFATAHAQLLGEADVAAALPRRGRASHKGSHGHVLVIGGGPGMPGAARLAGDASVTFQRADR